MSSDSKKSKTGKAKKRPLPKTVEAELIRYDEASQQQIISLAGQLQDSRRATVTLPQLESVAEEVGLEAVYVREAASRLDFVPLPVDKRKRKRQSVQKTTSFSFKHATPVLRGKSARKLSRVAGASRGVCGAVGFFVLFIVGLLGAGLVLAVFAACSVVILLAIGGALAAAVVALTVISFGSAYEKKSRAALERSGNATPSNASSKCASKSAGSS